MWWDPPPSPPFFPTTHTHTLSLHSRFLSSESFRHTQTLPNSRSTSASTLLHPPTKQSLALRISWWRPSCVLSKCNIPTSQSLPWPSPKFPSSWHTYFFLAGSEQWVGLCVSDWPVWLSLLCCLMQEVEPEHHRLAVPLPGRRSTKLWHPWACVSVYLFTCVRACVCAWHTACMKVFPRRDPKVNQPLESILLVYTAAYIEDIHSQSNLWYVLA